MKNKYGFCKGLAALVLLIDVYKRQVYIYQEASFMTSGVSFILYCIMEKVLVEQRLE